MSDNGYAHFYVYDATGKIVRMGTCSTDALELQARDAGEKVIAGDQDIKISLMLAAQAGQKPTHKIDLTGLSPALVAVADDIKI